MVSEIKELKLKFWITNGCEGTPSLTENHKLCQIGVFWT